MKLFKCQHCGQVVYFENVRCENCSRQLGFLAGEVVLSALEPDGDLWRALGAEGEERFRLCANAAQQACNWLVPAASDEKFCVACRHNSVIPDTSLPENVARWQALELAKHRMFYSLLRLKLPLANRIDDPEHGLAFEFLDATPAMPKVMTGHDNGLITLALTEADDVERERMRGLLGETYRTLLGHFRHEVGHYFWDVLIRDGGRLDACRSVFGDDSADYEAALKRHYEEGPPADWRERFISPYASSHPWEDFAETWAHYLHIVDTLEMAAAFGIKVRAPIGGQAASTEIDFDPYGDVEMARIIDCWLPLTFAVNSLNRSMGEPDLYPFVLTPGVIAKLDFIRRLVHDKVPVEKATGTKTGEPVATDRQAEPAAA